MAEAPHDPRHTKGKDEGRRDQTEGQPRHPLPIAPRNGLRHLGHQQARKGGDEGRGEQDDGESHAVQNAVGGQRRLPTGSALLQPAGDENVLESQKPRPQTGRKSHGYRDPQEFFCGDRLSHVLAKSLTGQAQMLVTVVYVGSHRHQQAAKLG